MLMCPDKLFYHFLMDEEEQDINIMIALLNLPPIWDGLQLRPTQQISSEVSSVRHSDTGIEHFRAPDPLCSSFHWPLYVV